MSLGDAAQAIVIGAVLWAMVDIRIQIKRIADALEYPMIEVTEARGGE